MNDESRDILQMFFFEAAAEDDRGPLGNFSF